MVYLEREEKETISPMCFKVVWDLTIKEQEFKGVKSLTILKFSEKIHKIKRLKTIHKAQAFQIENLLSFLKAKSKKLKLLSTREAA